MTLPVGKGYSSEPYFAPFNVAISGIELLVNGNSNTTEWGVGAIYNVVKSDGKVAISTKGLATLDVDVTHTAYRTGYYDDTPIGRMKSYQISSCYFSLPSKFGFLSDYCGVGEVLAEYERYNTKPIVVFNNSFKDSGVLNGIGQTNLDKKSSLKYTSIDRAGASEQYPYVQLGYSNVAGLWGEVSSTPWLFIDETYSGNFKDDYDSYYFSGENLDRFFNSGYKSYSAYADKTREELKTLLFETPEEGKDGYQKHLYSVADNPSSSDAILNFTFSTINETESNKFWNRLFNVTVGKTDNCAPIAKFDFNDLTLNEDDFSKKYLIGKQDVAEFKSYASAKLLKREDVWFFRYDCCDYTGIPVTAEYGNVDGYGLFAQEYVYLDFDILSFGLKRSDGSIWTIPVVHNREDVFPGLTVTDPDNPFVKGNEWETLFKVILSILAFIVVVFLIIYFWPYIGPVIKVIFKLLLWLVSLPFKLINALINKIKSNKRQKKISAKKKPEKKRK